MEVLNRPVNRVIVMRRRYLIFENFLLVLGTSTNGE
jgi:hypothetical protein